MLVCKDLRRDDEQLELNVEYLVALCVCSMLPTTRHEQSVRSMMFVLVKLNCLRFRLQQLVACDL
jgi:hypothetical protein